MNVLRINYWAVIVAAAVAFVGSSVWYVMFGKELAKVSPVFAELQAQKPAAWRMLAVFAGSLVLSFVVAYVIGLKRGCHLDGRGRHLAACCGLACLVPWCGRRCH